MQTSKPIAPLADAEILDQLKASDPVLEKLIQRVGPCTLHPAAEKVDVFLALSRAIIGQQISTAAAKTIYQRLLNLYRESSLNPQTLLETPDEELRKVGISRQKVGYLKDLAEKVRSELPPFAELAAMEDDAIAQVLTQVKGVGIWTVQMLLIFSFGRLDVLPTGDLGVRKAMQRLYNLEVLPKAKGMEEISQPWRPYRSIAVWYLWRSLDFKS